LQALLERRIAKESRRLTLYCRAVAWEHILRVRELSGSHVAKAILYALASRANEKGECWPSVKTLCRDSGLAERTVQTHLQSLVDQQLVLRDERRGKSTLFRLTLDGLRTGAADAPVRATTEGGACDASDPRRACVNPLQGGHPKYKMKEPRSFPTKGQRDTSLLDPSSGTEGETPRFGWWETNTGVDNKARELGVTPRPGETYPAFKFRVFSASKLRLAKERTDSR
jgi:DNA-binding transcriptional ArsR family regulator